MQAEKIQDTYRFGKHLGKGAFGQVKVAIHKKNKNKKFAVKSLTRSDMKKIDSILTQRDHHEEKQDGEDASPPDEIYEELQSELQLILNLDHPNIIKLHQIMYDNKFINIVMELVQGITLSDLIAPDGENIRKIPESECVIIMQQACAALNYLHSQGVAHRDLKPDNIMLCGIDDKSQAGTDPSSYRIKLIDFGLSKLKEANTTLNSDCGTLDYMAPEILMNEEYDEKCDMWALGVIAFSLLAGCPPFYHPKDAIVKRKIKSIDFSFDDKELWSTISKDCKTWIEKLLQPAARRMTAQQALDHQWFKTDQAQTQYKMSPTILKQLRLNE